MTLKELIDQVSPICLSLEQTLFQRQVEIGRLMIAKVGKGLKSAGGRKGPQEGSIMTLATSLAEGVRKSTGANYSAGWFKWCHLYASRYTDEQVTAILRHKVTQDWLMKQCGKSDTDRETVVKELVTAEPQTLTCRLPKQSTIATTPRAQPEIEPEDSVTLAITMTPEQIADKLAFLLRRERNLERREGIKKEILDVLRRV